MSNAPHLLPGLWSGHVYGDSALIDSAAHDGLTDAFDHQVMGLATDHAKIFDAEIMPVRMPRRRGEVQLVSTDEGVRPEAKMSRSASSGRPSPQPAR